MLVQTVEQELEALYQKVDALEERDRQRLTPAIIELAHEECRTNGLFWLRFVSTRDEADPERSVKPFPVGAAYLQDLWRVFVEHQRVVVAKSRQMLVSWVAVAFCVWLARFRSNQAIFWQSQQYDDAVGMIAMASGGYRGRAQFIEEGLPPWLQIPGIKCAEGRIQYPNGSMIQALAGGADKVRGKVASLYVGDEFARMEDQSGTLQTILPLLQKGARILLISTPNGSDNIFATIWHGRPVGIGA